MSDSELKEYGTNQIFIFTLATCGTCAQVKKALDGLGASYDHLEVDQLNDAQQQQVLDGMSKYNPAQTFPTTVYQNKVIVGYNENDLKQIVAKASK